MKRFEYRYISTRAVDGDPKSIPSIFVEWLNKENTWELIHYVPKEFAILKREMEDEGQGGVR